MRARLKWTYDPATGETTFRLGRKGCHFKGRPNPAIIRDAEFVLRQCKP